MPASRYAGSIRLVPILAAIAWFCVGLEYRTAYYDELSVAASAMMLGCTVAALLWDPPWEWRSVRLLALVVFGQAFAVSGSFVVRDVDVRRLTFSPSSDAFALSIPMMLLFSVAFVVGVAFVVAVFGSKADHRPSSGHLTQRRASVLAIGCAITVVAALFTKVLPGGILMSTLVGANIVLPLLVAWSLESDQWPALPYMLIGGSHAVVLILSSVLGMLIVPAANVLLVLLHVRRWPSRSALLGFAAVGAVVGILNPAKGVFREALLSDHVANAYAVSDVGRAITTWDESIARAWDPHRSSVGENTSSTMDRLDYNWALALVLSNVPHLSPHLYGDTLSDFVEIATPRLINPEKGTTEHLHQRWMVQLGAQSTESVKTTTIGVPAAAEAYWNWGWIGVVVVPLVVGCMFGGLLLLAPSTRIGETAYAVLCCGLIPQLLDMLTWFLCGMIVLAASAVLLRLYVRPTYHQ